MNFNKVTALFPPSELDRIEAELNALGVEGITVSRAHGFGLYRDFYARDTMVDSMRIEIFTPSEQADEVVETLVSAISKEANADGMIAVTPVSRLVHVRRFSQAGTSGPDHS